MNYVIYGDTGFAEEMYHVITLESRDTVIAFTNDRAFLERNVIFGLPVIPIDELTQTLNEPYELLFAYGYTQMNNLREKVYRECKALNIKIGKYISTKAICYTNNIEEGSMIWPNVYVGPGVRIGLCNIIKASATIAHDNVIGDFNYFAPGVVLGGRASVANHCFIGLNSTVKNAIMLADYTLLGSGSNMLKSSSEKEAYVGNPAHLLTKQSIELNI